MTGRRRGAAAGEPSTRDAGQVSVLVIGLVAIAVALVGIVASVSRVFLCDRALAAAADGAAAAAAGAVRPRAVPGPDGSSAVALSPALARAEVDRYIADAALDTRFGPGFAYDVVVVGSSVTVTLRARVSLGLLGAVAGGQGDGVGLQAEATARSAVMS